MLSIPVMATSQMVSEIKSDASLITSILAIIGTVVSYIKFKRKQFTDTITKERIDFIKEWRECATCFCELLTTPNTTKQTDGQVNNKDNTEKQALTKEYYYYKLLLMCNATKPEAYFDEEITLKLERLYDQSRTGKVEAQEIKEFIALMQSNISVEWQGAMFESQKGNLSAEDKEKLREENFKNYLKYIKQCIK